MAKHIKTGDMVEIIAGAEKGSTGRVMRVIPRKGRVVIEGRNRRHKHVKPSQKHPQGGRIMIEQSIDISNVLPISPKGSKGTRVRFETDSKGKKKRLTTDGVEIGVVTK